MSAMLDHAQTVVQVFAYAYLTLFLRSTRKSGYRRLTFDEVMGA